MIIPKSLILQFKNRFRQTATLSLSSLTHSWPRSPATGASAVSQHKHNRGNLCKDPRLHSATPRIRRPHHSSLHSKTHPSRPDVRPPATSTEHEPTTLLQKRHCDKSTREMSFEGCGSSSKWSGPVRQHHSKSDNFPSCKRNDERECVQPAGVASGRKVILLHTWWLVKADPDSHGKRLGIGGYTLEEKPGMRTFCSASIVKRHDAATLQTVDGITIMVHGYLNRSRTLENGFSQEVCDHFQIGFPYYWEDFAALSVRSEEPGYSSDSKGFSPSDAYKTPTQYARGTSMTPTQEARGTNMTPTQQARGTNMTPTQEARGTNMTSGNIFEASSAMQSMDSADHRTTRARKKRTASSNLAGGGPLTRSRARYHGAGWVWE